jgi:parvulin-like peptidyl-prolyl isomerase
MRLLTQKLQEAVTAETVQATESQVHARHILIAIQEPTPTPSASDTFTETAPITAAVPLTDLRSLLTDELAIDETLTTTESITATAGVTEVDAVTATDELTDELELTATADITSTDDLTGTAAVSPTEEITGAEAAALALAQELRNRILAGEDFATLAQEYSDDPSNASTGGDLGWFGRGRMVPEFDEVAFNLPLNEVSEPVKTQFGYHLIEVLERDDNRPKDEFQLQQERQQAFQSWLQEQKTAMSIERPQDLVSLLPSDLR